MGVADLFFKAISTILVNQNNNLCEDCHEPAQLGRGAIIAGVILAVIMLLADRAPSFAELGLAMLDSHRGRRSRGSACSITSTSCRYRASQRRRPTRAVPAAPASASTSRRARCSGSAGGAWSPGSRASGISRAPTISANAMTSAISARTITAWCIGIGAWLGTIMLFNVWVLIWPNQKKILGLVAATRANRRPRRAESWRCWPTRAQFRAVDSDADVHGLAPTTRLPF